MATPAKPWVVLKYGGTSVANVANWGAIVRRVRVLLPTNRVWLVVSALSQVRVCRVCGEVGGVWGDCVRAAAGRVAGAHCGWAWEWGRLPFAGKGCRAIA
jgi:hypothetical protein